LLWGYGQEYHLGDLSITGFAAAVHHASGKRIRPLPITLGQTASAGHLLTGERLEKIKTGSQGANFLPRFC
jgi:hypothetical protein